MKITRKQLHSFISETLSEADYERVPVGPEIKIEIPKKKKKVKKIKAVASGVQSTEAWSYTKHWVELERELVDLVFGGHYSDAMPPTGDASVVSRVDDIDVGDVEEAWKSKFGDRFPAEEERLIAVLEKEESRTKSTTWTLKQIQDIVQGTLKEGEMKITRNQLRGLIREELSRVLEISSKSMATTGLNTSSLSGGSSSGSDTKGKKSKSSRDDDTPNLVKLRDKISPVLTKIYGTTLTSEDLPDQSVDSGELVTIKFTLPNGHLSTVESKLSDAKSALQALGLAIFKLQTTGTTSGYGNGITISVEVTVPNRF